MKQLLYGCFATGLFFVSVLPGFVRAENSNGFPEKIVMVTGADKSSSFLGRWLYLTYNEAFKRLGIELDYKTYPWKRCSLLANEGVVDGELWRSPSYGDVQHNLVKVEETGPFGRFCAWTIRPDINNLNGWSSLKGTDYKIDYIRGTKVCESELPAVVKINNLHGANRMSDSLRRLMFKRTDISVIIDIQIYNELRKEEFNHSGIRIAGIMQDAPSHAYFHKKHTHLAVALSDVLKLMTHGKLYEKYQELALVQ